MLPFMTRKNFAVNLLIGLYAQTTTQAVMLDVADVNAPALS